MCCLFSVCVYVNRSCNCGSLLSHHKVQSLAQKFGPGPIAQVLREVIQACINCAIHERSVFNILKEGTGKVSVTGTTHERKEWLKKIPEKHYFTLVKYILS